MTIPVRTYVLNKTTKQVKRSGYCDFENDGVFDSGTEETIQSALVLDPDIDLQDWYWNSSTEEFQETQP